RELREQPGAGHARLRSPDERAGGGARPVRPRAEAQAVRHRRPGGRALAAVAREVPATVGRAAAAVPGGPGDRAPAAGGAGGRGWEMREAWVGGGGGRGGRRGGVVGELARRRKLRGADVAQVAAALPGGWALVEFVYFRDCDFKTVFNRPDATALPGRYAVF